MAAPRGFPAAPRPVARADFTEDEDDEEPQLDAAPPITVCDISRWAAPPAPAQHGDDGERERKGESPPRAPAGVRAGGPAGACERAAPSLPRLSAVTLCDGVAAPGSGHRAASRGVQAARGRRRC